MGIRTNVVAPVGAVLMVWAVVTLARAGETVKDSDCLLCHEDKTLATTNAAGKVTSLYVDVARLKASIHAANACTACHNDLTDQHPDDHLPAQPVNCARCHARQSESYDASVHGLALKAGDANAPTCKDCHDSHDVLPPNNPASPLHFSHLAQTCGACHDQVAADVQASVHGKASAAGERDAATCIDCHSEHQIQQLRTNATLRVSAEICSRCHASERINTKFNLPKDRVKTFFESYHGLASQYGSTVAANCASCHGYHLILPSTDARSTINPAHLVQTCGRCHPGATVKFASGKVHVDAQAAASADLGAKASYWVRRVYLVLIFGTIGFMLLHNGLLYVRKMMRRYRSQHRPIVRMNLRQRGQHFLLLASFTVLAVTGFALKFPESWIGLLLGSNENFRRWTHRLAGVVLLLLGVYHLLYVLFTKEGRQLVKDFLPARKDAADLAASAQYLSGLSAEKPKIGRFGYAEKMEYWAVIWGTIIMGATGLIIWLKMDVTQVLPRWAVEVATTIHYYEAVLACLAIVAWHLYHVLLDPDIYPLNFAVLDGKVSAHWVEEEHPLDPSVQLLDGAPVPQPKATETATAHPAAAEPAESDATETTPGPRSPA